MTTISVPQNRTYRSIDVGYWSTKFFVSDRQMRMFPSLAPRADAHRARITYMGERRTTVVVVDGNEYEVGEDAGLFHTSAPVLHRDYTETPEYRALVYAAMDAMKVPRIDLLVTGLPVHLHERRWEQLQKLLKGVHEIRPGITVEVCNVAVTTQPTGGLIAHCRERGQNYNDKTFLTVDPGMFTFDWLVTRGLKELPGRSGSVECGMSQYLRCIEEQLSTHIGDVHMNLRRIDDGLRQANFRINGRPVDLRPFLAGAEEIVDRAINALRNRIGSSHDIDEIIVVGGGGPYYVAGLRRAFSNPIREVAEPVFANLRGFQILAELHGARMAA